MASSAEQQAALRQARRRNSLPASYSRLVLEIVTERGIEAERLLDGTRLSAALLDSPDFRVAARDAARVVFNALELTDDQSLGLEFGLRTRPTTHGYLGYAAMSCKNVGEAMAMVQRFVHLRQRDITTRQSIDGEMTVIHLRETHDLGPLRQFFIECLTIGIGRMAGFLIGEKNLNGEIWFDWPEPHYFAPYRERLWFVRFDKPEVQIRFPRHYLSRKLLMADPIAAQQAIAQCERELALTAPRPEMLLTQVRDELQPGSDGYPDLKTLASCLFMSERTLKRKLQAHGTGYRQMLDDARYRDARKLLENSDMAVAQIGQALGYRDAPSFTRAYKKWSGETPVQTRRKSESPIAHE